LAGSSSLSARSRIVTSVIAPPVAGELTAGRTAGWCPNGTSLPVTASENWLFLDANTGKLITGALQRDAGPTKSSY